MINKYIRLEKIGFVIWSGEPGKSTMDWQSHYNMSRVFPHKVTSAGFCGARFGEELACWGESESLGIGSTSEDIFALRSQLGINNNG